MKHTYWLVIEFIGVQALDGTLKIKQLQTMDYKALTDLGNRIEVVYIRFGSLNYWFSLKDAITEDTEIVDSTREKALENVQKKIDEGVKGLRFEINDLYSSIDLIK